MSNENSNASVGQGSGEGQDNLLRTDSRTNADKHLEANKIFLAGARELNEAEDKKDEREMRRLNGQRIELDLRMPQNLFRSAVAPPFELNEVPPPIAYLADMYSRASGHDRSGVIMAATVAAASMITDSCRLAVRTRSGWFESARLWGVLVGPPSDGKSPCIKVATNHIETMHVEVVGQWKKRVAELEDGAPKPPKPALYTSDSTIAALEEVLKDNEQGILLRTGEFATWIGMIDGATRGDGANNRGNWLQLYDGGPKQSNRISRGDVLIPNWSASVLAACTPDGLRNHLKETPEDGLIHRFLPVIMQRHTEHDPHADAQDAQTDWAKCLRWLRTISPMTVNMSPKAEAIFESERSAVRKLAEAFQDFAPSYAAQLGKHGGQLARIALTFHCLTGEPQHPLAPETMELAARFMRKAHKHVFMLFDGILSTSQAMAVARALARSIAAEEEILTTFGRQWMSDHCAEFRKAEDKVKQAAVHILEDADWIEPVMGVRSYGGWHRQWNLNQGIWRHFSKEGELWRARRAAVKEAIGADDQ